MAETNKKSGHSTPNAARILCLILVIIMLLGSASTAVILLISSKTAAYAAGYTEPIMSIGIQYGDSAVSSYRTYSETGYILQRQSPDGDRSAVKIGELSDKTIIVEPSSTSSNAVVVKNTSGQVLYEYNNSASQYLSIRPAGSGDVYMRTDNYYIYEGSFMYKRDGNLLTVINMVGLETYIEGVLPYEISSSWHVEAQKAFAIAARSYAIGNRGKHYSAYGFDLCSTTNCQVYRGAGGVNDTVKKAVADTAGKVLTWNGKAVSLYYSSSTGGNTVSAFDCWGGSGAGYLTAISTPWERYADYNNGFWTVEVSPAELCTYLRDKGYTSLTGSIASVSIAEFAENSSYVKSLKITDTSGNSVTITGTDKVRTTLGKYLKSANFVVGKGSVAYTVSKVTPSTETLPYNSQDMSSFNLLTSVGKILCGLANGLKVAAAGGRYDIIDPQGYVITADSVNGGGDQIAKGYETKYTSGTAAASSGDNFIFVGKGWGHGLGLSQYGTKDLAEFGYTYDRILSEYVPAAVIKSVSDIG